MVFYLSKNSFKSASRSILWGASPKYVSFSLLAIQFDGSSIFLRVYGGLSRARQLYGAYGFDVRKQALTLAMNLLS